MTGSLLYTCSAGAVGIVRLLMVPVIVHHLSPTEFGWYALAMATAMVLAMIGTLGFDGAVGRAYFEPQPGGFYRYLRSVLLFQAFWNLIIIGSVASLGPYLFSSFSNSVPSDIRRFCLLVSLLSSALALDGVVLVVVRMRQQPLLFAAVETSRALGYAFLVFTFLRNGLAYRSPLIADISVTCTEAVLLVFLIYSRQITRSPESTPSSAPSPSACARQHLSSALAFGVPLIPGELANWITGLSSRFVLAKFLNAAQVGVFSFGYTLSSGVAMVASAINNAYSPFFFNSATEGKKGNQALGVSGDILAYIMGLLTLTVIAVAKPLVQLLGNANYLSSLSVLEFSILGFFYQALYLFSANGLYFVKKTKWFPIASGVTAVVNVVSNFLLVPALGIVGAGIAAAVSYLCLYCIVYAASQRNFPVPYSWRLHVVAVLVTTLVLTMSRLQTPSRIAIGLGYLALSAIFVPRSRLQLLGEHHELSAKASSE